MSGGSRQPVLNIFRVFVVMRVLVAVCVVMLVRMRMVMVMRVFMFMKMLLFQSIHIHHRLSIFCILQNFVLHRKPPRGMKFCVRRRNRNPLRGSAA